MESVRADIAIIKEKVERTEKAVEKLVKIVIEGNGNSLVGKMLVAEEKIKVLQDDQKDSRSTSLSIRIAMWVAGSSFIGTLILAAITFLKG